MHWQFERQSEQPAQDGGVQLPAPPLAPDPPPVGSLSAEQLVAARTRSAEQRFEAILRRLSKIFTRRSFRAQRVHKTYTTHESHFPPYLFTRRATPDSKSWRLFQSP